MHASRGSRAAALSVVLAVTSMLGLVGPRSAAAELPAGFRRVVVASGLQQPTAFAFKNKKIFVTEKASGKVQVVLPDGSLRPTPYVTLSVSSQSERGLLGIALDPNFAVNQFVYVYYTTGPGALRYSGSPMNRVSRFTTVGGVGTSETIILDNIPSDAGNHNGGDIQFGFDGLLYVTVGDGGQFHDDAQGLGTLRGKILRVNPDGTIPANNPHRLDPGSRRCGRRKGVPPGTGPCREIYAYGLRNPFRMSLRQSNQSYIIADVGQNTWEELNTLVADGNYGWNAVEGPCPFRPPRQPRLRSRHDAVPGAVPAAHPLLQPQWRRRDRADDHRRRLRREEHHLPHAVRRRVLLRRLLRELGPRADHGCGQPRDRRAGLRPAREPRALPQPVGWERLRALVRQGEALTSTSSPRPRNDRGLTQSSTASSDSTS